MANILVAEDDEAVRAFVARALSYLGHQVRSVPDGSGALVALEREDFDLVLTDIVMPVMDGIALALKIAKEYPSLKVLMMTGYADEKQRAHNLDLLIHNVVAKPFTLEQICDAVGAALESEP
jgi:CheY-like chemotaxis protein